jgi:hypothetical protein
MLGHKAKDIITGLEGVITAQAEFQHAPTRYELTPNKLNKDGVVAKSVWMDEKRLKVAKAFVTPTEAVSTVTLGQDAKDSITGFKGIVTGRYTFLNGCIRLEITSKTLKDGTPVDPEVFDERRLEGHTNADVPPAGPRPGPTPYSQAR